MLIIIACKAFWMRISLNVDQLISGSCCEQFFGRNYFKMALPDLTKYEMCKWVLGREF